MKREIADDVQMLAKLIAEINVVTARLQAQGVFATIRREPNRSDPLAQDPAQLIIGFYIESFNVTPDGLPAKFW